MIKIFYSFLSLLWVLLVGTPNQPKHDLRKQPKKEDINRKINLWIERNFGLIALATIVFLLILFVLMCFWLVGVSAVESGIQYNHFEEVI